MKIENIWQELESDKSFTTGLLFRRYSSLIKPDILIGIRDENKLRFVAIGYDISLKVNTVSFEKLRDIKVEAISDPNNNTRSLLVLILSNFQLSDIFSVVCEDIIITIANIENEKKLLSEVLNRIEKWQALFEKLNMDGLSPEAQRGLYGELYFLRKMIPFSDNKMALIQSWVGPSPELQDFQSQGWAVEVKTSSGNNHQRIYISNERQLDESVLDHLFLFHLSLDVRPKSGEKLNDVVNSIKTMLHDEYAAHTLFCQKLLQGGYFDQHKSYYEEKGYTIREEKFFKIQGDFPRLKENNIPHGVGDVSYSVNISECFDYIINDTELFKIIKL